MNTDALSLAKDAFRTGLVPANIFLGGQYGRGLDGLKQALAPSDSPALALLTAPDGCGKSVLLGRLVADVDETRLVSRIRGRFDDPEDFLVAVLVGFGFDESGSSRSQLGTSCKPSWCTKASMEQGRS